MLARAFGAEETSVNSVHYQGVDRLGDGLSIEATAPDGVVEAVEKKDYKVIDKLNSAIDKILK